ADDTGRPSPADVSATVSVDVGESNGTIVASRCSPAKIVAELSGSESGSERGSGRKQAFDTRHATNARVGLSVAIHISELEGRPVLGRSVSLIIRKRGRPHIETPEGAVALSQRAADTGVSPPADITNTIAIYIADTDCFIIARKGAPSGSVREFGENKAGRNEAPFRKLPAGDARDRIQRNKLEGGKECSLIWRRRPSGDNGECASARVRASGRANALNETLRHLEGIIARHIVRVSVVQLNNPAL